MKTLSLYRTPLLFISRCAIIGLVVCAVAQVCVAQMQQQMIRPNYPIKVIIENEHKIDVGGTASLKIVLADADNMPAASDYDMTITVHIKWPSGKEADFPVAIPRGQTSNLLSVPMKSQGLCRISANEQHLLGANAFIIVNDPVLIKQLKLRPRQRIVMRSPDETTDADPTASTSNQGITILHPDRPLLADGKDSAKIEVILTVPAQNKTDIYLSNSLGTLTPSKITINKDEQYAYATVTSKTPGTSQIKTPTLKPLPTDVPFDLKFVPAIVGLKCLASPPSISLMDKTEIQISLVDENGVPQRTDIPRMISLAIDTGRGELAMSELVIPAGEFGCRTSFTPTMAGVMAISGTTSGLHPQRTAITVSWPLLLLALSVVGSTAGGFIAKRRQKTAHWRILIGVITGAVLYWAFIGPFSVLPHSFVLNPFSAFAISVLGGWLGTEVFSIVTSQLGLNKKSTK